MNLTALSDAWRTRAQMMRDNGAPERACRVWEKAAKELDAAIAAHADELLPLKQAARESGFSRLTLKRYADAAIVPNRAEKPGEYLFRRGDLPRKPGHGVERPKPALTVEMVALASAGAVPSRRQTARALVSGS